MNWEKKRKQVDLLIKRLERLSSDSIWAHRASGIRGSLLEIKEELADRNRVLFGDLDNIMDQGYFVLGQAAREGLKKNKINSVNPGNTNELSDNKAENRI